MSAPATAKQLAYIASLGGEATAGLTVRDASALIDRLKGSKGYARGGNRNRSRRSFPTVSRGRCEDAPCCGHEECGFGPGAIGYGYYAPTPRY